MIILPQNTLSRWAHANAREDLRTWRQLSEWIAMHAMTAQVRGQRVVGDDLTTLSDLAWQRYMDLMPVDIEEAA
jgi:hypothetical protein